MKTKVPHPKFLPITVNVVFSFKWNLHNGEKLDNIQVRPFSTMQDLLKIVEERCKAKGDSITDWNMD